MRLSAKLVNNYANLNMFGYTNQWFVRAGDPNILYFQLVDLDQDGLRYLTGRAATPVVVRVTFPSIDDSKTIQALATQVNAADGSLWQVNILPTMIPGSGNVIFSVTEGNAARSFKVMNALSVEYPGADGSC
jgi:hypothetical protein